MVVKNNIKNLFERLRKRLGGLTSSALIQRIQRKANSLGITTEEAIFVLAKENKIGYLKAFKKLPLEKQIRVTNSIQVVQPKKRRKYSQYSDLKPVILKTKFGSIDEPFLSASVKRDAKKMAEKAYLVLYMFENSIRNFINMVLKKEFGQNWWSKKMNTRKLSEIADKVKDRMKKEEWRAWHGKRGSHPLYYSDFPDLILIFENYEKTFNKYFDNQKGKSKWLLSKLYEIEPSRNVVAHHNPLSDRDLSRVEGYLMDWIKQLEFIRDYELL